MIAWWHRVATLVVKELLALLRDPRSRLVLVGPPLVQLLVFSYAATLEVENVALAVLDRDGGPQAQELIRRIEGSPTFRRVIHLAGEPQLRQVIDAQQAIAALHIDQGFGARLAAGEPARLQLVLDGRRANAAQIVQGYLARIVDDLGQELLLARGLTGRPALTVERAWFNANLEYLWFTVPSLVAILTMLVALVVTALSVARERELGTFDQLLVSPLSPAQILLGKTLPAVAVGLAEGSFMVAMAVLAFGVPLTGALWLLYLGLGLFLLSVVGVGLLVSSLSRTQQQAILGAFAFMAPAVLLSGYATPVENMPGWLQWVTFADPLRHMLVVVKGVFLKDMPLADAVHSLWPMAAIAAVTLPAAAWLFRRRME